MLMKLVSMRRTSPTQAKHFRALYMSQKREEAAHIQKIRRLCGFFTRANRKIAGLERSIAELTAHRHSDVKPPLTTESHRSQRFSSPNESKIPQSIILNAAGIHRSSTTSRTFSITVLPKPIAFSNSSSRFLRFLLYFYILLQRLKMLSGCWLFL
jgi:hypothetical protein